MQIQKDQVTRISDYRYTVEASDLGLAPGKFPKMIEMGPFVFFADVSLNHGDEVYGVRYECYETREALDILND